MNAVRVLLEYQVFCNKASPITINHTELDQEDMEVVIHLIGLLKPKEVVYRYGNKRVVEITHYQRGSITYHKGKTCDGKEFDDYAIHTYNIDDLAADLFGSDFITDVNAVDLTKIAKAFIKKCNFTATQTKKLARHVQQATIWNSVFLDHLIQ
jgi:hypothetical protein